MGLIRRIINLIKANINWLLTKLELRDPVMALEQSIEEMQGQFEDAKRHVAQAMVDEKRLERAFLMENQRAEEWEQKAIMALKAGDEGIARQALGRKREHARYAEELEQSWKKQKEATDNLREGLRQLSGRIEEAKRRKAVLIARHRRAEAQQSLQRAMSTMGQESAFEQFSRIEQRIEEMEMEAEARAEVELAEGVLERRIAELAASSEEVEVQSELEELRARVAAEEEPPRVRVQPVEVEKEKTQPVELSDENQTGS